ncbi:hypothetical protein BY458DRAFT_527669 [Sporodiniella umbellata]|nr:hypothetical protein BY458DRAFT_527669 [Sporodiniella umbellata]
MATFLEQPYFYQHEPKGMQEASKLECFPSPLSTKERDISEAILTQMRQQMFNSTSAIFPLPENLITQLNNHQDIFSLCKTSTRSDNTDPFHYRQQRSEHLLLRMLYCNRIDIDQSTLMRLSKGVFVHQVCQAQSPQSSPTLSTIQSVLYETESLPMNEAPVHNFNFAQIQPSSPCYYDIVPFSYTFGARYTNPYSEIRDIVIRGKLPLWCQSLFLSTCLKHTSLKASVPIQGLLPFAPHIKVTLVPLSTASPIPELTLLYERLTNDHDDPYSLPGETDWPICKRKILDNILIYDIPDLDAAVLENMARQWAAQQGFLF